MGNRTDNPTAIELKSNVDFDVTVKLASQDQLTQTQEQAIPWSECKLKIYAKTFTLHVFHDDPSSLVVWDIDSDLEIVAECLSEYIVGLQHSAERVMYAKMRFESVHALCDWLVLFQKAKRPKWDPEATPNCRICRNRFTFFKRQHHCRNCGMAICARCSPSVAILPHLGYSSEQRVCYACSIDLTDIVCAEMKKKLQQGQGSVFIQRQREVLEEKRERSKSQLFSAVAKG